ncbi:hypothetical protein TrVGV298_009034 [Trichoderma virens]|nr:hypothetical protein TrVGV298_009034 [Trichoderma virens]
MALPATQKAVIVQSLGVSKLVTDRPIPKLRDDYILVKTVAVGLNPTDWKHVDFLVKEGGPLIGCDYAGIVEAVGPAVTKSFKKGDRVCGVAHGSNVVQPEDGTFAEYIVAKGDLQIKIPDNMTFEEAATLGVSVSTVGQSLYQFLDLALPTAPSTDATPILIYGGSTATGILVKSLGADAVFNYNDPDCAAKIREYTNNSLTIAWDTISLPDSAKICEEALSSSPSPETTLKYHSLLQVKISRTDVKATYSLAYTAIGEAFTLGGQPMPAKEEDFHYAVKFWDLSRELFNAGKLKASPIQVGQGLEGIPDGLQALKANKVSGKKLVYRL